MNVLKEAEILDSDYLIASGHDIDLETELFQKLDPKVKKALLDLAPIIKKTLQDIIIFHLEKKPKTLRYLK